MSENEFLKVRVSLLEGFIINTSDKKKDYLFLIDTLINQVSDNLPSSQPLIERLELYRLDIEKLEPAR